jgi:hypothetical protein
VLISNFALKIINFVLAVLSRGPTGPWIDVQCGYRPGFSDQNCSMLSIFEYRFCVTDSSPVMADKKGASVHLVRMHKLKKAQSTYPVVNHAQDIYQLVIGYN